MKKTQLLVHQRLLVGLTDREEAILTLAVIDMSTKKGVDPMNTLTVIQVEARNLLFSYIFVLCFRALAWRQLSYIKSHCRLIEPSKDQNFDRQTYPKKHAGQRTCCIIPKGRYVVTGQGPWRLITPQEMGVLHGLGLEDWHHFGMDKLSSTLAQSFLGNARLRQISEN